MLAGRDDELDRLKRGLGPPSEKWKSLLDGRDRSRTEYDAIAGQLGRPVSRHELPAAAFYALALCLAIIETPVNKFLFDVALQSSNAASYLVSFAVATFVLIAAHTAGKLTRQVWSEYTTRLYLSNAILAVVIMTTLMVVVMILTIGRAEFSAAALDNGLGNLFSTLSEKVAASGLFGAFANALGDTAALILMTMNLTSILVAFLLGYFAHDPDKHLDKAFERQRALQRGFERYESNYYRQAGVARRRSRAKLDAVNIRYTGVNAAIGS